jgi:hypothetical protein
MDLQDKIYFVRDRGVMLDFDLAAIYEVETGALKRAVRRNIERFPGDFMFELTRNEYNNLKMNLRCQIGASNEGKRGGVRYMPFAFTREGVAMLSGVLNSDKAIQANINIMRAFVSVREDLLSAASSSAEIAQLRERMLVIEQATKENAEAVCDLSEDIGKELDNIYNAIGALSVKVQPITLDPNRRLIGYKRKDEQ